MFYFCFNQLDIWSLTTYLIFCLVLQNQWFQHVSVEDIRYSRCQGAWEVLHSKLSLMNRLSQILQVLFDLACSTIISNYNILVYMLIFSFLLASFNANMYQLCRFAKFIRVTTTICNNLIPDELFNLVTKWFSK
jgi:hypothetical protein